MGRNREIKATLLFRGTAKGKAPAGGQAEREPKCVVEMQDTSLSALHQDDISLSIDVGEAIAFLAAIDPDGRHQLAAIHPDTKRIVCRTFRAKDKGAIASFIRTHNPQANIYYSLNEVAEGAGDQRASEEDIAFIRGICADADPDKNDPDQVRAKAHAQAKLDPAIKDPEAYPTAVVDSGGGYQAIWLLEKKLPATEFTQAARNHGYGLALALGTDHTHDTARLLRLPGTINHPDAKKRARGRTRSRATLLEYNEDGVTTLEELGRFALPVRPPLRAGTKNAGIEVCADALASVTKYDELPNNLKIRFEALQGIDDRVAQLWAGDKSGMGSDDSGSGFSFALARLLRPTGDFTPTEFGMLLKIWDYSSEPEKIDGRYVSRAWLKAKPSAPEEFSAANAADVPLSPAPERRSHNVGTTQWSPKRTYIVQGLLKPRMLALLTGKSNTGKSPLALDLAAHIVKGIPWQGHKVKPGYVYHASTEGWTGLGDRIEAIRREHNFEGGAIPFDYEARSIDLRTSSRDALRIVKEVQTRAQEFKQPAALVIIDTLSHALAGGDESNPEHVRLVLRNCQRITQGTGAAVLMLHHPTKNSSSDYRGSSILVNDTDLLMTLETDERTKVRTLKTPRIKEFAEIEPKRFRIKVIELGKDEEGDSITSVVVKWVPRADSEFEANFEPKLKPAAQAVYDALLSIIAQKQAASDRRAATFTEWSKEFKRLRGRDGGADQAINRALNILTKEGWVIKTPEGEYRLPGEMK